MASNKLPASNARLIDLAGRMRTGIVEIGASIPVTMLTAAELLGALNNFTAAAFAFDAARSAQTRAAQNAAAAMDGVYTWLLSARLTLVARWGERWSTTWAQAGFTSATTAIPRKIDDRLSLTLLLVNFLTANPGYEVPALDITAAYGTALRDLARTARGNFIDARIKQKETGQTRQTTRAALVSLMRALINNLTGKLTSSDPRWRIFGLNIPAQKTTPAKPENLTVSLTPRGAISLACDAAPSATRYRWRCLRPGSQTKYDRVASTREPMAMIKDIPPGQTLQFIVQAIIDNAQSIPSDPVQITIPPVPPVAAIFQADARPALP